MSKVLNLCLHKVTLGSLQLQTGFFESLEDDSQVLQVFFFIFAEYDDVIQICDSKLV